MLGGSRPIAALIGPFCSAACESTAFLANARNIAQISPACSSPSLSNQEQFSTFVRTTGSYAKLADPILALLQQMSWTRLSILADTSNIMQMSAGSLIDKLGADKLGAVVQFVAGRFEDTLLARIQRSSVRIVMVYAYTTDYVAIAEAAWKRQMLAGWAWLALDMLADVLGEAGENSVESFLGWLYLEPLSLAPPSFLDAVRNASIPEFSQDLKPDTAVNSYAANFYDAVTLFARTVGSNPETLYNGREMTRVMRNASFEGMSGHVAFDGNDLKESITVKSYQLGKDGALHAELLGVYRPTSHVYQPTGNAARWPGSSTQIPKDIVDLEASKIVLGVLLPLSGGGWLGGRTIAGAVAIAVDDINTDRWLLRGKTLHYVVEDDQCEASVGLAAASQLLTRGDVQALIGPGCSTVCETTGFLTKGRNALQISYACSSPSLSNKDAYPTFVRTTSPYSAWAPALVGIMRWVGWTKISTIATTLNLHALAVDRFRSALVKANMSLVIDIRFKTGEFDPAELPRVVKARQRVMFVLAYESDVVAVGLAALAQGMMSAGWAWLGVDNVPGADASAPVDKAIQARAALNGWLYLEPFNAGTPEFFERVKNASTAVFNVSFANHEGVSPFAANLYDAVMLFARTASVMLDNNQSLRDGRAVIDAMSRISFPGVTGAVRLDSNGDMFESMSIKNYVRAPSGEMIAVKVGHYDLTKAATENFFVAGGQFGAKFDLQPVIWPGYSQSTPVDEIPAPAIPATSELITPAVAGVVGALSVILFLGCAVYCKTTAHIHCMRLIIPFAGGRPF